MARTSSNRLWGNRSSTGLWGSGHHQSRGEIDMRKEFSEIVYGNSFRPQRGHYVVYRRFDITKVDMIATSGGIVGNYDEVYREGVGGPAHPYKDEIVITRKDPVFSPEAAEPHTTMGIMQAGKEVYFFEHTFKPKVEDQIFEIEWDNHTVVPTFSKIPTPYLDKYNIKEVFPYRCDGGRISYWISYVEKDRVNY